MSTSRGIGRRPPSQRTHGHSFVGGRATTEYNAWKSMRDRCLRPNHPQYPNYGGRGITVCERWLNFNAFLSDMGCKPAPNLSLDRIDNDKGYEPGNCRWATWREQCSNKRNNKHIEVSGERMTIEEATRRFGVPRTTLRRRLATGWAVERAVTP